MSSKLKALEGMSYSKADEMKKKEEALELRRQQMAARTRMKPRERESAEAYEAELQRNSDREAFKSAPKKGVMDELGDIFKDFFGDDPLQKKPASKTPPPGRAPKVPGFHG
jgi:hypothetical protein